MSEFLSYGAIGLGLALAILSYHLLSQEQKIEAPRGQIIKAIYVFMSFSLVIAASGVALEFGKANLAATSIRSQLDEIPRLQNENSELAERNRFIEQKLVLSRKILGQLLDLKEGKIARLGKLKPDQPGYEQLLSQLQLDLNELDEKMSQALQSAGDTNGLVQ